MSNEGGVSAPVQFVAASSNAAKRSTLQQITEPVGRAVAPPEDISPELLSELARSEDAATFAAIARGKALAWSRILHGKLVVATDGGLLVPGLGRAWNPLHTRRFAGEDADDVMRARALLALAAGLRGDQRRIARQEALVLAKDGQVIGEWVEESSTGVLATEFDPALIEAGNGFWIPAIWLCPDAAFVPLATLSQDEQARRKDHWLKLGTHLRQALNQFANQ